MINVHPSLLPRWRGAAPIERAIMAGDARDRRVDHARDRGLGLRRRLRARPRADPPRRRLRHARPAARALGADCSSRPSTSAPSRRSRTSRTSPTRTRSARASARWTRRSTPEEVERTIRALRPAHRLAAAAARRLVPRRDRRGGRRPDPRARRRPRAHRGRPAAARLQRRRARADRGHARPAAARWPPPTGCAAAPTTSSSNFRFDPALPDREPRRDARGRPRGVADADDEWQPHVCALAARGSRDVSRR